jgi:hypothetical protein
VRTMRNDLFAFQIKYCSPLNRLGSIPNEQLLADL